VVQYLQHKIGTNAMLEPVTRKLKFKASSFYKSKKVAQVLQKDGYVFQLDSKPNLVNPDLIQEQLTESAAPADNLKLAVPQHEVDLHIETLLPQEDPKQMSNSEILRHQL